jgi:hypothetical protein
MKKGTFFAGIAAVTAAMMMGCGSDTADTTTLKYAGTVMPGDFVHFSRTGGTLEYHVEGDVFGDENGTVSVTDLTGDGYIFRGDVSGAAAYFFTAGNIGMAALPLAGTAHVAIGLRETLGGLTDDNVIGTYVYAQAEFDRTTGELSGADGCEIELKYDHTAEAECTSGTGTGRWDISTDNTYVLLRDGNATTTVTDADADARVVIRPADGDARKGFLVDVADGGGFGIGLEAKEMTQAELTGDYFIVDYKEGELSKITVEADASDPRRLTADLTQFYTASGWEARSGTVGEILINQGCDGVDHDGVACVIDESGLRNHAFVDNTNGYFVLVREDNFVIGVKEK